MIQKLVVFILMAMTINLAQAQDSYHVLQIKGTVKKSGGLLVKRGDKLTSNISLRFMNKASMLLVNSQKYGRMVLHPNPKGKEISETSYLLSNLISRKKASTRSGALNNSIDLKKYLETEAYLILGKEASLKINPKAFPMSENAFFYLNYQYEGESINKILFYEGNQLFFSQKEIFKIDDTPIVPEKVTDLKVFYYEKDGQKSTFISDFNPVFIPEEEVKTPFDSMIALSQESEISSVEILEMTENYLVRYYGGKIDKAHLRNWLIQQYQIDF